MLCRTPGGREGEQTAGAAAAPSLVTGPEAEPEIQPVPVSSPLYRGRNTQKKNQFASSGRMMNHGRQEKKRKRQNQR